jgi:hypothetical protein
MKMKKLLLLTIATAITLVLYFTYGNQSHRDVMEQECRDKNMTLQETDFFELDCVP